jgi:hypothetical protein
LNAMSGDALVTLVEQTPTTTRGCAAFLREIERAAKQRDDGGDASLFGAWAPALSDPARTLLSRTPAALENGGATATVAPMPPADTAPTELTKIGERLEPLIREYFELSIAYRPIECAATVETNRKVGGNWRAMARVKDGGSASIYDEIYSKTKEAMQASAIDDRKDAVFEAIESLFDRAVSLPVTSMSDLRVQTLCHLFEHRPTFIHGDELSFEGEQYDRALFDGAAVMTGLASYVQDLEARFAADADATEQALAPWAEPTEDEEDAAA